MTTPSFPDGVFLHTSDELPKVGEDVQIVMVIKGNYFLIFSAQCIQRSRPQFAAMHAHCFLQIKSWGKLVGMNCSQVNDQRRGDA